MLRLGTKQIVIGQIRGKGKIEKQRFYYWRGKEGDDRYWARWAPRAPEHQPRRNTGCIDRDGVKKKSDFGLFIKSIWFDTG